MKLVPTCSVELHYKDILINGITSDHKILRYNLTFRLHKCWILLLYMLMTPNLYKRYLSIRSSLSLSFSCLFYETKKWKKRVSSESITDGIVKGDGDEVNWIFLENKPDNFFECSVRKSTNTTTIWSAFDI